MPAGSNIGLLSSCQNKEVVTARKKRCLFYFVEIRGVDTLHMLFGPFASQAAGYPKSPLLHRHLRPRKAPAPPSRSSHSLVAGSSTDE